MLFFDVQDLVQHAQELGTFTFFVICTNQSECDSLLSALRFYGNMYCMHIYR